MTEEGMILEHLQTPQQHSSIIHSEKPIGTRVKECGLK